MKCPCHKCEERTVPCHDTCERYRSWRPNRDEALNALKRENDLRADIGESHYNRVKRARRGQ